MRRILIFCCAVFLLSACESKTSAAYEDFLSKNEDTLSILVVENSLDNFSIEEFETNGIERLVSTVHQTTVMDIKSNEYGLELEKKPAYVLFTNKDKIFITYSKDELFKFLRDYQKDNK